jgi:hypothetical protein
MLNMLFLLFSDTSGSGDAEGSGGRGAVCPSAMPVIFRPVFLLSELALISVAEGSLGGAGGRR